MNKLKKLYELYLKQCSYQVAGNEWSKPLAFHVLLSQMLRRPDPENPGATIPMSYLRSGREIPIRLHLFAVQGARSGKGELMHNMVDVLGDVAKAVEWSDVRSKYLDSEPTTQALKGGNEKNMGNKSKEKWIFKPGVLSCYSILAWSEGESLINPRNSYGDFKHVILSATDDKGEVSLTARKDLILKGEKTSIIPSFNTTCSIVAGSTYKENFVPELLNSGLLQRFLLSYHTASFETNIGQLHELMDGLILNVGGASGDARKEFLDYFMDNVHGQYMEEPVEWSVAGVEKFKELVKINFHNPGYLGQKLDAFNSFVNATQKHMEKIAAQVAIVDGETSVGPAHIEYAWKICIPVFQSYTRLLEAKFTPDISSDVKIRVSVVQKILNRHGKGGMVQKELLEKLKIAKKKGEWDMGYNKTLEFLGKMGEEGIFQMTLGGDGRTKRYWMA